MNWFVCASVGRAFKYMNIYPHCLSVVRLASCAGCNKPNYSIDLLVYIGLCSQHEPNHFVLNKLNRLTKSQNRNFRVERQSSRTSSTNVFFSSSALFRHLIIYSSLILVFKSHHILIFGEPCTQHCDFHGGPLMKWDPWSCQNRISETFVLRLRQKRWNVRSSENQCVQLIQLIRNNTSSSSSSMCSLCDLNAIRLQWRAHNSCFFFRIYLFHL